MKFMIMVKATAESEANQVPDPEMFAAMGRYNDELVKAGIMKKPTDCDGLQPSSKGARVRFSGKNRTVTKGPFTGDLVAGYWFWECKSTEEAIEWVKKCPNPMNSDSDIEIRPIVSEEEFASMVAQSKA